jgi:hypothetical protein
MSRRWVLFVVIVASCKKAPGGDKPTPGSDQPGSGSAPPPAASWKIDSQPVELLCGSKPLALPTPAAPGAKGDRALAHADAIPSCQDQASVAAVCDCLTKSIKDWGGSLGLSPAVQCELQPPANPDAQIVEVSSKPADDSTSGGEAFVFVAKHGAAWSPVAVIEDAPDVDLSVTPKASHTAKIDHVEAHAIASGNLYWIDSHHEAQEKSMGDSERDGEAHGTACIVPTNGAPYCGKPLVLGAWTYAFTVAKADQPDACKITKASTYAATVDATSVTTRLVHGSDDGGIAGRYTL